MERPRAAAALAEGGCRVGREADGLRCLSRLGIALSWLCHGSANAQPFGLTEQLGPQAINEGALDLQGCIASGGVFRVVHALEVEMLNHESRNDLLIARARWR